jgi:L-lactate dehydrogenase complex protein LldG
MPRTEVSGAVGALCGRWAARRIAVTEGAMEILGEGPGTVVSPDEPPRDLSDVDVAVLRADHGVAENGAVALAGRDTRPRALHVLCQRAIVLLDVAGIVGEMHAAVAAASQGLARDHHLTWVSGPSKTADIESTLVIGAHGPRELVVLLFDA